MRMIFKKSLCIFLAIVMVAAVATGIVLLVIFWGNDNGGDEEYKTKE